MNRLDTFILGCLFGGILALLSITSSRLCVDKWEAPESAYDIDIDKVSVDGIEVTYTLSPTPYAYVQKVQWGFMVQDFKDIQPTPYKMFAAKHVYELGSGVSYDPWAEDYPMKKPDSGTILHSEEFANADRPFFRR